LLRVYFEKFIVLEEIKMKKLFRVFLPLCATAAFSPTSYALFVDANVTIDVGSYQVAPDRGTLATSLDTTVSSADAIALVNSTIGSSPLDAQEINNTTRLTWGNVSSGTSSLTIISHKFDIDELLAADFQNQVYANNFYSDYLTSTEFGLIPEDDFLQPLYSQTAFSNSNGFGEGSYIPIARIIFENDETFGGELAQFNATYTLDQTQVNSEITTDPLLSTSLIINTDNTCDKTPPNEECDYDDITISFPGDSSSGILQSSFHVPEFTTGSAILWGSISSFHGYGFTSPSLLTATSVTDKYGVKKVYYPDGRVVTVPEPAPLALMIVGFALIGFNIRNRNS